MRIALATCSVMPDQFTDDQLVDRRAPRPGRRGHLRAVGHRASTGPASTPSASARRGTTATAATSSSPGPRRRARTSTTRRHSCAGTPTSPTWATSKRRACRSSRRRLSPRARNGKATSARCRQALGLGRGSRHGALHAGRSRRGARARSRRFTTAAGPRWSSPFSRRSTSMGETALVFIDGEFSHSLRKRAVLQPDEVAPVARRPT